MLRGCFHSAVIAGPLLAGSLGAAPAKLVVGHQMLAMPRYGGGTTVEHMREEVRQWKDMGLDGTLLFEIHGDTFKETARKYYRAGQAEGYRFAISTSYFFPDDIENHARFLAELAGPQYGSAQLQRDGRPYLSAYHAPSTFDALLERLRQLGVDAYAEPQAFARVLTGNPLAQAWESGPIASFSRQLYAGWLDHPAWRGMHGYAAFEIPASIAQQADEIDWLWDAARARGKTARVSIVPYYKGLAHKGNWMVREGWGFARLQTSLQRAIDSGVPAIEFITLNDFGESSYVNSWGPDDPTILVQHWNTHDLPAILDHSGFRYFSKRYIEWFKTGREPAINEDELYYAYRLHPRDAASYHELAEGERAALQPWIPAGQPADVIYRKDGLPAQYANRGGHWNNGLDWRKFSDGIHVAVRLKAPADVFINGALVGANLPAGEHLLVKPGARHDGDSGLGYPLHTFGPSDFGRPRFEIRRHGRSVVDHTGELEITPYSVPGCWNVFARRAPAASGGDAPAAPETSSPATNPPADAPPPGRGSIGAASPADIGGPARVGGATYDASSGTLVVTGGGADIWEAHDQFHFVAQPLGGDLDLAVRVDRFEAAHPWAKAGLMVRESADAGAVHASVFVTPSGRIALQWRERGGGGSFSSPAIGAGATVWLRLIRQGDTITALTAEDGAPWREVHSIRLGLPDEVRAGLAVTAHDDAQTGVATFSNLSAHGRSLAASVLQSMSTRGRLGGDQPMIAGFVVTGDRPRSVLVRVLGPTLGEVGVSEAAAAARLDVFRGAERIASAGDWGRSGAAADIAATVGALGAYPMRHDSRDSAVRLTLAPGAYTAHASGADGAAGVALLEVHDADDPAAHGVAIVNLSTRGMVEQGAGVLIAGFIIEGATPKRMLVRGVGPGLQSHGVSGVLADPQLQLYRGAEPLQSNDNWSASPDAAAIAATGAQVGAFPLAAGGRDAALLVELAPGAYTVHVSGADGGTGVALVEIYQTP